MEELRMAPDGDFTRRPDTIRNAFEAYQAAAWRAPAATRFDSRPANDFLARAEAVTPMATPHEPVQIEPMPRWLVVVIGALIAAILGALLGGAMAV